MEQIKIRIKKELLSFAKKYGSEAEKNVLKSSKSLQRFMTINTLQNAGNDSQNESTNSKPKNIQKKEKKKKRKNKNMEFQIIDKVNEDKNENKIEEKEKNEDTSYISNNDNDNDNNNDNNNNNENDNGHTNDNDNKDENINNEIEILKSNKNSQKDLIFDFSKNQSSREKETILSKVKEKCDYIKSINVKYSSFNSINSNSPKKKIK
jgi:hypothetical protein